MPLRPPSLCFSVCVLDHSTHDGFHLRGNSLPVEALAEEEVGSFKAVRSTMHPDRKIWPVVVLLLVFLGLTAYFARRIQEPGTAIEVDSVSGYLAIICGAAAVVTLGVALVVLWVKRNK